MSGDERIVEIEAFRVGPSSRGIGEKELDEAIASYKADTDPAPLVFGHPESDDPAHGIIASARRVGAKLMLGLKNISDDAVQGVKEGRFLNRSIAFWHPSHSANPTPGKWNIRHLGLLGAKSPGIPGMPRLAFSADESAIEGDEAPDAALIFKAADEPTGTVTISEKGDKVSEPDKKGNGETVPKSEFEAAVAERDELKAKVEAAERQAEKDRKAGNAKFVADQIEAGRVTPGDKVLFTEILNALPTDEVTFDADAGRKGSLGEELRRVLSSAEPRVIFDVLSPTGERKERGEKSATDIVAEAEAMVEKAKADGRNLTFEAAVEAIEARGAK